MKILTTKTWEEIKNIPHTFFVSDDRIGRNKDIDIRHGCIGLMYSFTSIFYSETGKFKYEYDGGSYISATTLDDNRSRIDIPPWCVASITEEQ